MGLPALDYDSELWLRIPLLLRGGLYRYFAHHIAPGSFLRAVLEGNCTEWELRGDSGSLLAIGDIADWLVMVAPRHTWGDSEKVSAWLRRTPGDFSEVDAETLDSAITQEMEIRCRT